MLWQTGPLVAVPEEVCLSDSNFTVYLTRRSFPVSFTLHIYSGDLEVSWDDSMVAL